MIVTRGVEETREQLSRLRKDGAVAFVPTMGNLHEGHLMLVRVAHEVASKVAASIFVNPMQFGAGEDFGAYPRTFEKDSQLLTEEGTDLLFAPSVETIYGDAERAQTRVEVPELSDLLCGATRPGHFVGVATVVCKLFNIVQPDVALFGNKDYQQLMVIRRMVEDLDIPVRVIGVDTVREEDGLAMSSRNGYLTADERARAPVVYRAMGQAAEAIAAGADLAEVRARAEKEIAAAGLKPDYFEIRRQRDLLPPEPEDDALVILAAAYLGRARLIDNLECLRPR